MNAAQQSRRRSAQRSPSALVTVRPSRVTEPVPLDAAEVAEIFSAPSRSMRAAAAFTQGNLAIDFRGVGEDPIFGPQATIAEELPDAAGWARNVLQATLECWVGDRNPRQLIRSFTPELHERISDRHRRAQRNGKVALHHPGVRAVRISEPRSGIVEVAAVVWLEGRVRAAVLRMVGADRRWLITQFAVA